MEEKKRGRTKTQIFARCVGYLRPINQWNDGLAESFKDRKMFKVK